MCIKDKTKIAIENDLEMKTMKKNEILVIDNLPPYGSLIVKKQSGGLGGEIYIIESDLVFFEPTG